ncbi:hypothetical protein Tco_1355830 [Tanacetum coccineum]
MPYDSPLLGVHTPRSDEGRMKHDDLIVLVTNLTNRVEALEKDLQKRARIVLSKDEEAAEDPSKQGRKVAQIDSDPNISLVQDEGTSWFQQDEEIHEKTSVDTKVLVQEETPTELIEDLGSDVSTASHEVSTAAAALAYIRMSASKAKDKGKAIMTESEPLKKLKKRVQMQLSVDKELARKIQEEDQAKAMAE